MPGKHVTKQYEAQAYYHLYNRGVEKRIIFLDEQDYGVFLSYLKTYLLPKDEKKLFHIISDPSANYKEKNAAKRELQLNNFFNLIQMNAYILMSNHFHFLVQQSEKNAIDRFMNSLCTRYTMYFNKKYHRVGPLFQSQYKAVRITSDEQLIYITRYIHRNIISKTLALKGNALQGKKMMEYPWSSYAVYIGKRHIEWLHPKNVLGYFGKTEANTYASFAEMNDQNEKSAIILSPLDLES